MHCTPETFLTDRGDGVKRNGVVGKLRFRFGPALMNQRALSARAMCFHGSFASQMGCSTAVVVTLGHSVSIPSSLSVSPTGFSYGYSPLNPLISSRVLSSTAIDSVGRRDRRAERIVLFSTKPGLRVQFLPLPKAGRDDVDDNRPQVAADIYRGGGDGHGHQTSADNTTPHRPDNGAKRRRDRRGRPRLALRT